MAYQTKQRDPLFDSTVRAELERRGWELLGAALLVIACLTTALLWSYNPEDPSWFSAPGAPAQNWLGRFGAGVAAPLFIIIGLGSWSVAAIAAAWGIRFVLHAGEERATGRLIFAPIAIALAAIYASMMSPDTTWTHNFGLGGLFGDTILGALLNILPISAGIGVRIVAIPLGIGALAMMLFVMGFSRPELTRIWRFLLIGVLTLYLALTRLVGRTSAKSAEMARNLHARRAAARSADAEAALLAEGAAAALPEQDFTPAPLAIPTEPPVTSGGAKPGLLASARNLVKRAPEPELVEPEIDEALVETLDNTPAPTEDRIKSRISDAIKSRARMTPAPVTLSGARAEPPVARARGPVPLIIPKGAVPPAPMAELDPEPQVTSVPPAPAYEPEAAFTPAPQPAPAQAPVQAYAPAPTQAPTQAPAYAPPPAQAHIPTPEAKAVVQHPVRKPVQPSTRAKAEAQPSLALEDGPDTSYELPPLGLLEAPQPNQGATLSDEALEENARMLESVLDDYGVKGEITSVRPGPVVTMYELEPAPGLKASRVIGLADDIARSMSALSARVSTVPGRSVIGIELPNETREKVMLREIFSAADFGDSKLRLPLALGKDIGGDSTVANLAKMPHLLIAGTTGSGKSVAINTMILSLLYRLTPDECRLIMIDPKMLELSVYDGIPHLLSPVVTDPKKAVVALKWVVGEMEDRYRKMSKMGVRNIEGYNGRVRDALAKGEMFSRTIQTGFDDDTGDPVFETEEFKPEVLPFIVVIVDEMADLMMVAGKEIEACIQRLAQMARASGIHLIMATQRPSVDVITGTIKANFPTRISFQVTSKIDSRTILGEMGAEQLLGMGDMLYMEGGGKITRLHGPFVSDEEVEEIVNHLKAFGPPEYVGGVVDGPAEDKESNIDAVLGLGGNTDGEDALYDTAVQIVINDRKCSTSYIQRKLAIGYNKAARLVEQMEDEGVVSSANHVGKREVLVPEPQ
ncbi:DNA translocase FtsK 4TM domain-containing protein [Alphaproteobacteria bacterium KMM 3653]|uniref:DNA translocase FtsK n=1 Tax=Harenicola maris TaxID=2841044 RepID=A0AAP2CUB9_9RHOB|nr:DNA translocase FtsK 4TM domain-containing protein [Harenicola maris]